MCLITIRENFHFTVVCFVIQWLDIVFINDYVIITFVIITLLIIWPYILHSSL